MTTRDQSMAAHPSNAILHHTMATNPFVQIDEEFGPPLMSPSQLMPADDSGRVVLSDDDPQYFDSVSALVHDLDPDARVTSLRANDSADPLRHPLVGQPKEVKMVWTALGLVGLGLLAGLSWRIAWHLGARWSQR